MKRCYEEERLKALTQQKAHIVLIEYMAYIDKYGVKFSDDSRTIRQTR